MHSIFYNLALMDIARELGKFENENEEYGSIIKFALYLPIVLCAIVVCVVIITIIILCIRRMKRKLSLQTNAASRGRSTGDHFNSSAPNVCSHRTCSEDEGGPNVHLTVSLHNIPSSNDTYTSIDEPNEDIVQESSESQRRGERQNDDVFVIKPNVMNQTEEDIPTRQPLSVTKFDTQQEASQVAIKPFQSLNLVKYGTNQNSEGRCDILRQSELTSIGAPPFDSKSGVTAKGSYLADNSRYVYDSVPSMLSMNRAGSPRYDSVPTTPTRNRVDGLKTHQYDSVPDVSRRNIWVRPHKQQQTTDWDAEDYEPVYRTYTK